MKIAVIGSGISGLTAAHYLRDHHELTIFEANAYLGGHTATVEVPWQGKNYAIDTGFIVFNDRTYPNFEQLLSELSVESQNSEMSYSVHDEKTGFEYNGHTLRTLFAQKRHWFSLSFYGLLWEVIRFNRLAKQALLTEVDPRDVLVDFLNQHDFSERFCSHYLLPMGAAIWSSSMPQMKTMPLQFFLQFFQHHGLLDLVNRPQWRVVKGGSKQYVEALISNLGEKHQIALNTLITSVIRQSSGVWIKTEKSSHRFDEVIFACHSDQALALLDNPTPEEQQVLSALPYQKNTVVLHTDTDWLPKRSLAWASWNYRLPKEANSNGLPTVTYNMNRLQGLTAPVTFCVTLNPSRSIDATKVLQQFTYEHPIFTRESWQAQQEKPLIQGKNRTWFCGAYWGYGFHEDGVNSALEVVRGINSVLEFRRAS